MKTKILVLAVVTFCTAIFFSACQKDSSTPAPDEKTQVTTESDDQNTVSNEADAVANDVDAVLEASASFSGRGYQIQSICDATIEANVSGNPWTLTVTYNGSNCAGTRTRTGAIVVSMPSNTRWKNAGAAVTVTFQDFKITRKSDNKSVTFNGSITYTNVTGGLLLNLTAPGTTITHTLTSSGLNVKFNDGTQRSWEIAKQRNFTYDNGYVVTTTGTHTDGNTSGIAIWGTNRYGKAFTWQITQGLVVRQDCSFRIVSGQVVNTRPEFKGTATFGLDSAGNPTTCPATGSYYVKVVWEGPNSSSGTVILPY